MPESTTENPAIENEKTTADLEPKAATELAKAEPTPEQIWEKEDDKVKRGTYSVR